MPIFKSIYKTCLDTYSKKKSSRVKKIHIIKNTLEYLNFVVGINAV